MPMNMNKQYYVDKINKATDDYHNRLATAPSRPGWDPVFRKRIASARQIEMQYFDLLRKIVDNAAMFGYDLQKDGVITLPDEEV